MWPIVLFDGGTGFWNGRSIRRLVSAGADTPLEEGRRYLLFLKFTVELDSYRIVKHWKLDSGRVVDADLVEARRASQKKSEFAGRPESEIIAAAEKAIRP